MQDPTPAMTVRQVAQYLNVNEKTVYRLAQRGGLPGFKVAGAWRFQRDDLDGWIAAQKREVEEARNGGASATAAKRNRRLNGGSAER